LVPLVMIPLAGYLFWFGVLGVIRLEFDRAGLTVTRRAARFSLPWAEIRSIGVVHAGTRDVEADLLVAWPGTPPPPGPRTPAGGLQPGPGRLPAGPDAPPGRQGERRPGRRRPLRPRPLERVRVGAAGVSAVGRLTLPAKPRNCETAKPVNSKLHFFKSASS